MTTVSDLGRLLPTDLTFFNGGTASTDMISKITPTLETVSAVANTAVITFTNTRTGAPTPNVILRSVHDPELSQDAATKNYVDSIAGAGVTWKNSSIVLSSTTESLTGLSNTTFAIDGVTLVDGDRVVLAGQGGDLTTADAGNGIYEYNDVGGGPSTATLTRTDDAASGIAASGAAVFITEGTTYGDTAWVVTTDGVNFGTALVWTQFSSAPAAAGSTGDVQYNDGTNNFAAESSFNWSTGSKLLSLTGTTTNPALTIVSGDITLTEGDIFIPVSSKLDIGAGDLIINDDGTNHAITNSAGSLTIEQTGNADLFIRNSNSSAGADMIFSIGTSNIAAQADTTFRFRTAVGDDIFSISNDTNFIFNMDGDTTDAAVGSFTINTGNDGLDSLTPTFIINPLSATTALSTFKSGNDVRLEDDVSLQVGTGGTDLVLNHDGTDSTITNATGKLDISNTTASDFTISQTGAADLIIKNTDTTAGSDVLFLLGTSNLVAEADTAFRFQTAAGDDIFSMTNDTIFTFNIDGDTTDAAVGSFTINMANDAIDTLTPMLTVTPVGATGVEGLITFKAGSDVLYEDAVEARFGTDSDTIMVHSGTVGSLTNTTGTFSIIENAGNNATNILIENQGTGATNDQGIILKVATGTAVDDSTIQFQNGSTTLMKVDSKNDNSTSTTTGTVTITGGLGVSQDVYAASFNASSDATLKKNIEPLKDPLRTLNKIEGYSYDWINDGETNPPRQWGCLAQQIQEVGLGHMVSKGDVLAVNYLMLIPLLIESVKELTRLTLDDIEEE